MNDENSDGIVDPGLDQNGDGIKEFVKVFVRMRRGGDNYYALDATPSVATGPLSVPFNTADISPRLSWRIEGNSTQFPRLGQTWSRPKVTQLRVGTTVPGETVLKTVLVFAGGYDDIQDTTFTANGLGNAIYVVDAETGARLFWISGAGHGGTQGVLVPDMSYPIPSDVAMFDSNADGTTDRLYVGDTGGQVWRVDFAPDTGPAAGMKAVVGKFASVTGDLFDVTTVNDPSGLDLAGLQTTRGFHLDLTGSGEKGLAPPIVLAGTVYFTTYLPDGVISSTSCALAEGAGLLYAINVLNGAAVFNWDGVGSAVSLAASDRTYTLGGGVPSGAVPIFQAEGITLLVGGGGGATTIDPNLALPRARTYWTGAER